MKMQWEYVPGFWKATGAKGRYRIQAEGNTYSVYHSPWNSGGAETKIGGSIHLEGAQDRIAVGHDDGSAQAHADRFFSAWDKMVAVKTASPVGQRMILDGWHAVHTGGGCACWQKDLPGGYYLWICDEGNGLGDQIDEAYIVALYEPEGEDFIDPTGEPDTNDLEKALAWAKAHEADPAGQFKAIRDGIKAAAR